MKAKEGWSRSPRPKTRASAAALTVSLGVLLLTPLAWAWHNTPLNIGVPPVTRNTTKRQPVALNGVDLGVSWHGSTRVPSVVPLIPAFDLRSARLVDDSEKAVPPPVRLAISSIHVDAHIVPVGIDAATGGMQVPQDVRLVGWYRFGPVVGEAGSSVLVGHVDSARQGPGVFFSLRSLSLGASVLVTFGNGSRERFMVIARHAYRKAMLPEAAFARSGRPMLLLITCGGKFDPVARRYQDNVVVYARPWT